MNKIQSIVKQESSKISKYNSCQSRFNQDFCCQNCSIKIKIKNFNPKNLEIKNFKQVLLFSGTKRNQRRALQNMTWSTFCPCMWKVSTKTEMPNVPDFSICEHVWWWVRHQAASSAQPVIMQGTGVTVFLALGISYGNNMVYYQSSISGLYLTNCNLFFCW